MNPHPHPEALYFHIALDALRAAQASKDRRDDRGVFERKQAVTTAFVFSLLCLEAFINQEFDRAQIVTKTRELSLSQKWLHLPALLGEKDTFDKSAEPYRTFAKLTDLRTRLVHFKPSNEADPRAKEYFGDLAGNVALAERCVDCLGAMIRQLNRLTHGKTALPPFLEGARYVSTLSRIVTLPVEFSGHE